MNAEKYQPQHSLSLNMIRSIASTFYATLANIHSRLIHACAIFLLAVDPISAQQADNAGSETTARTVPPTEQQHIQLFMSALDDGEAIWIGEEEQATAGLYRQANKPYQMAVVTLASHENQLLDKHFFKTLYSELPLQGWSALGILLPAEAPTPALPERSIGPGGRISEQAEEDKNNAGNQAEGAETDEPDNTSTLRIKAATQYLTDNGAQSITLVADETNISHAIDASIDQADVISGLVLWQIDRAAIDKEQLKKLKESRISLFDVVNHHNGKAEQVERRRLFEQADFIDDYKQVVVPAGDAGIAHSSRRLRQWLKTEFRKF